MCGGLRWPWSSRFSSRLPDSRSVRSKRAKSPETRTSDGFPLVDNYRILYAYFCINTSASRGQGDVQHAVPCGAGLHARGLRYSDAQLRHAVLRYSSSIVRSEPMGADTAADSRRTVNAPVQLMDLYTHNFGLTWAPLHDRQCRRLSSPAARSGWRWPATPEGIASVVRCETTTGVSRLYRTAVVRSCRYREREEDSGRLHRDTAVRVPRTTQARGRTGGGLDRHRYPRSSSVARWSSSTRLNFTMKVYTFPTRARQHCWRGLTTIGIKAGQHDAPAASFMPRECRPR